MTKKIILITILLLIIIPIAGIVYFFSAISNKCGVNATQEFEIQPGTGVNAISYNLKKQNIVCDSFAFETYLWLLKSEGKIKAGKYIFNLPLNIQEVTQILITGQDGGVEKSITFIEGWSIQDMDNYLETEGVITKGEFIALAQDKEGKLKNEYDFLSNIPKNVDLEGFLFPDTYRVFKDATGEDVIIKMLNNFDSKLSDKMKEDIKAQGKTIFEIVTMASVIEKEVRSVNDMKIVSGIFWDRIKNGQPLESCATIGYILGEDKIRYSYEDTRIDSLYNTYINRGLPIGPISNPGLQAIEAAIYPEFTDYNYFLSTPEGETIYSATYEEHLRNSDKYLK